MTMNPSDKVSKRHTQHRTRYLSFTKMQGLGNDFMVLNLVTQNFNLQPNTIKKWSDRHFGIGFDQLLVVDPPDSPEVDFGYRIFNADGSQVEQCGNGARCFAKFVRKEKLTKKRIVKVGTLKGTITLEILKNGQVMVDMGVPVTRPADIPFSAEAEQPCYSVSVNHQNVTLSAVSLGNPHGVVRVDSVDSAPVAELGPALESHSLFPKRANIGFMEVVSPDAIRLRVFERGVGETLACGSGACAAVVAGVINGWLATEVSVELKGGRMSVFWEGPGHPLKMSGPAVIVYEGRLRF